METEIANEVSPMSATWIMLVLIGVMLLIPAFEKIPILGKAVSLRWSLIVVTTAMMVGVIINFSDLSDDIKKCVIIGGMILAALFLVARSIEKAIYNGVIFKANKIEAGMGDKKLQVEGVEIGQKSVENDCPNDCKKESHDLHAPDDLKGLAQYENEKN